LIEQSGDYVLLEGDAMSTHEGIEPMTRRALDKLMMDARDDRVAREEITGYFRLHPEFVQVVRAAPFPPSASNSSWPRYDVSDEMTFADSVRARLEAKSGEAALGDLLMLLEREPSLRSSSRHACHKQQIAQGGLALIRCDGGGQFGDGHVRRMIAMARAFRDREGVRAIFAVHGTEDALAGVRLAGFEADLIGADGTEIESLIAERRPDFALFDCRTGPSLNEMARISKSVEVTAVIDDLSERRLAADLAYYSPIPLAQRLDWHGSACTPRIGWEWTLLALDQDGVRPRPPSPRPTLLVAVGGGDKSGLALCAARGLARLDAVFRARFVIDPQLMNRDAVASAIVRLKSNFETIEGADNLANEYASADLALAVFGDAAYQLAAHGVPALYLCLTEEHALSASAFEYAGMGLSLGAAEAVSEELLAKSVWALLGDTARRREMRAAGLMTLDGEGAARIADDLANALAMRRASSPIRIAR
jgi:spore coat polysaccharide biosynthesis protein SpsF